MASLVRHSFQSLLVLAALIFAAGASSPVSAQNTMTPYQRQSLNLRAFTVTDQNASYFDVEARRAYLRATEDASLRRIADRLELETGCQGLMALPVVDYEIELPSFYQQRVEWRRLVQPIFAFEQAVTDLGAAHLVSDDRYHADCLVDFLVKWAKRGAFERYDYASNDRQAWHNVEAAIFASAMAYSIVRPSVPDRASDLAIIEAWMLRLARRHVSFSGGNQSCCNNHLYRRGTYAAMIGVLTGDNSLFQFGVGAIYSALYDASEEGALPHEMERGRMAGHYQNFASIYLVMIAQIVERQGYSIFDMRYRGSTLHEVIDYNIDIIEDPATLGGHDPNGVQNLSWTDDPQYFAWAEIYLSKYPNPRLETVISGRRPLYNRSTGGYLTLLFYEPSRWVETSTVSSVSPELRPTN